MSEKLKKKMRIHSWNRCAHCGHPSCDDEDGFRIYTEARANWLEHAAEQCFEAQGDDEWFDWMELGEELTRKKQ